MTSRGKPGVAFFTAVVLLVLLVGYPLSAGPYAWASLAMGGQQSGQVPILVRQPHGTVSITYQWVGIPSGAKPAWLWRGAEGFYAPLAWAVRTTPSYLRRPYDWYLNVWTELARR